MADLTRKDDMRTVTLKCDRCGATAENDKNFLKHVAVGVNWGYGFQAADRKLEAEWCRECLIKAGLHSPQNEADEKIAPLVPPTLEDLVRDIVRDEMANTLETTC